MNFVLDNIGYVLSLGGSIVAMLWTMKAQITRLEERMALKLEQCDSTKCKASMLAGLDDKVFNLRERMDQMDEQHRIRSEAVSAIEQIMSSMRERVAKLETNVSSFHADIIKKQDELKIWQDKHDDKIGDLKLDLVALRISLDSMSDIMKFVKDKLT